MKSLKRGREQLPIQKIDCKKIKENKVAVHRGPKSLDETKKGVHTH